MTFKFEVAETKKVELPDGEKIDVREPNLKELRQFKAAHEELKGDEDKQLELTIAFLEELGFPSELAYQTSEKKLLDFISWLTQGKKS